MADLSKDQAELRAQIQKSAAIWGVVAGVLAGLIMLWILAGQGAALRFGGALVMGLGAGFLVFRGSFGSQAKSARCAACGAAFSRARSDRAEALKSSEAKEERDEQPDGSVMVTTWTEERYDVTDTYACAQCGDTTTQEYETTRRRNEETKVEPAPTGKKAEGKVPEGDGARGGKKAAGGRKGRSASSRS